MPKKEFEIDFIREKRIHATDGQTILEASLAAGIPHYHDCGGKAECSTCRILVITGSEHLNSPNEKEKALVKKMQLPPSIRLACQTRPVGGPVRLHRIIRDDSDVGLYQAEAKEEIGEEKELVMMFLDIRNFTPFAASFLPFDVIHILKKMFAIFQLNIDMHDGRIIDTAGDGLYAVFGMEGDLPGAARSAIAASENILHDINEFNDKYLNVHFFRSLQVGIGLHAGNAIKGKLRIDHQDHLTVMGFAVNVASRIQAATRELNNNFLVSENILALLPEFSLRLPLIAIKLKGIANKVNVYPMGVPYW